MNQAHRKRPRKKLATVRVPGNLQVKALFFSLSRDAGLVREEYSRISVLGRARQGARQVREFLLHHLSRRIGHTGNEELGITYADNLMTIEKNPISRPSKPVEPRRHAPVILMIARHIKLSETRFKLRQWTHERTEIRHPSVYRVPREYDQIRPRIHYLFCNSPQSPFSNHRSGMNITDLDDSESVECGWEFLKHDFRLPGSEPEESVEHSDYKAHRGDCEYPLIALP